LRVLPSIMLWIERKKEEAPQEIETALEPILKT